MPNEQLVERIVILDSSGEVILNDNFNCKSYMIVKDLLNRSCELVTYNGYLLDHMLWKFWNRDYAKIVDLMESFAVIYARAHGWIDEDDTPFYAWQKLSTALSFYGIEDCSVDIYNPLDVIQKTRLLHIAMTVDGKEAAE